MRIVTDLHHGILFEAFAMLFVDRAILGPAELVGWADGTYHKDTGLGRWGFHTDFPPRTVEIVSTHWLMEHGADIVIATVGGTRGAMRALASDLGALYVDHLGNQVDAPIGSVILRSVAGGPGILYHPEFHRVPWTPPVGTRVAAFHNSFATMPCRTLWDRWAGPDWHLYGATADALYPYAVAQARSECAVIWHCKDADGYGFAVHEAFASGRPVIGHAYHYKDKLAEPLFVRNVTYVEPEDFHPRLFDQADVMGLAAKTAFDNLVDFNAEAFAIADYLENAL